MENIIEPDGECSVCKKAGWMMYSNDDKPRCEEHQFIIHNCIHWMGLNKRTGKMACTICGKVGK